MKITLKRILVGLILVIGFNLTVNAVLQPATGLVASDLHRSTINGGNGAYVADQTSTAASTLPYQLIGSAIILLFCFKSKNETS